MADFCRMDYRQRRARRKLVSGMLAFTHGTPLEASFYERRLLRAYVKGHLTLKQVEQLLAA